MFHRLKRYRGNLLLLAAASVVSLAMVEGVLAVLRPQGDVIGRLLPGVHTVVNHEFTETITVNRFGFRDVGFEPGPSTRSVLLLGDSFVEGTGQADDETLGALLNRRFPGKELQFFNAGISGTDIADYADTYRRVTETVGVRFARVVVVLFLGNDLLDYERVGAVKRRRAEEIAAEETDQRWLVRVAEAVLPHTVAMLRQVRDGLEGPPEGAPEVGDYDAHTHIDWFDENSDYFGRGPLTEAEERRLEERFARIPAETKELMARSLVNRWCYHPYLIEPLQDFVYNMDSEQNERVFLSTMRQLGSLIDRVEVPVSVVIVPDKLQVSEAERAMARRIMGPGEQEDELHDMLAVNARTVAWLHARYPGVGVYDATPDLLARGAEAYYYRIDEHMRPAGAALR